jgi:hypothetical protein
VTVICILIYSRDCNLFSLLEFISNIYDLNLSYYKCLKILNHKTNVKFRGNERRFNRETYVYNFIKSLYLSLSLSPRLSSHPISFHPILRAQRYNRNYKHNNHTFFFIYLKKLGWPCATVQGTNRTDESAPTVVAYLDFTLTVAPLPGCPGFIGG